MTVRKPVVVSAGAEAVSAGAEVVAAGVVVAAAAASVKEDDGFLVEYAVDVIVVVTYSVESVLDAIPPLAAALPPAGAVPVKVPVEVAAVEVRVLVCVIVTIVVCSRAVATMEEAV